jgi:hypothetical protein
MSTTDDYTTEFVTEVLRAGLMLSQLASDLIESTPEDAFPGESTGQVIIEMMIGTIRPAAEAAGEPVVRACIGLLAASCDRTLADLRAAADQAGTP